MVREPASGPPDVVPGEGPDRPAAHGWGSWVIAAGIVLVLVGAYHVVEGVVALAGGDAGAALLFTDPTAWGWAHVTLGVAAGLAGLGVLAGLPTARVLGVVFAVLSVAANIAYLGVTPVASIVVIAVDVVLIYALAAHGGQLRATSYR
jgi:hypothetical protein